MVAPPWFPVPPADYGGIEMVCDLLGRGLRDRGHEIVMFATGDSNPGVAVEFLDIFGRPARVVSCECERVPDPNLSQTLRLMNGEIINRKITQKDGRLAKLMEAKKSDSEILDELYMATVGRPPGGVERSVVSALMKPPAERKTVFEDVLVTLLNSKEFLFNH